MVLLYHTPFKLLYQDGANWLYNGFVAVQNLGWTGVDLFFVLSGFLVGGLLLKEIKHRGRLDVGRFIIRRGFKIWPGYYVYVFAVFIGLLKDFDFHTALNQMTPNLLHLQNYARRTPCDFTWSLSIEEHFYLALPLLLALLIRGRSLPIRTVAAVPLIAVVVMAVCLPLRLMAAGSDADYLTYKFQSTQYRADSLFFGVLLAYLYYFCPDLLQKIGRYPMVLLLGAAALLVPVHWWEKAGDFSQLLTTGYCLLYLAYGCLLVSLLYTTLSKGLIGRAVSSIPARALAWLGVYSYSIYLWHLAFRNILYRNYPLLLGVFPAELQWPIGMIVYLSGAVLVGYGAAKAVEVPALKLRDRLFPAHETIAQTVPIEPTPSMVSTRVEVADCRP